MVYDIKVVAKKYVSNFFKFVENNSLQNETSEVLYDLFSYAINEMYGLESHESGDLISKYGKSCIEWLKETPGTPKRRNKIDRAGRVSLAMFSKSYFVAVKIIYGEE